MNRRLLFALGFLISAVCVWWELREVNASEIVEALRESHGIGFIALMVLTLMGFWVRAYRWRWLINIDRKLPTAGLFSATMIGFMANNLLPFRLGEFVRPMVLSRREKLSKSTLFATIVVERVVDMITLLAIFGVALLVHPISSNSAAGRLTNAGAGVLVALCVALTAVLVIIERSPRLMSGMIHALTSRLPVPGGPRLAEGLHHFVAGLGLFRDLPRLLWVFLLSFITFGFFALCLTVSMWAMHLDVPWYAGLIMLVITAIGIMVPAAPGYIGTLNLACVAGLALFSVSKQAAIPFSWFFWAGQWIPITVVGLWYLRHEGLSFDAITHAEEAPAG
jgi:uncharacterized protein (TIRG00374 family)